MAVVVYDVVRAVVRSDASIALDESYVAVAISKTVIKCLVSSVKQSSESQATCAILVKVRIVVALCEAK